MLPNVSQCTYAKQMLHIRSRHAGKFSVEEVCMIDRNIFISVHLYDKIGKVKVGLSSLSL